MPGQSVMRGTPQTSPPTSAPLQHSASKSSSPQSAPGPRLAAIPVVGYAYPGAADTSTRAITPEETNSIPRPAGSPAIPYNGYGLPGTPLEQRQYTGMASEPVAVPSLVAEGLANVDPDDVNLEDYQWRWQMLPKSLIYHTYLAGVKEPRLGAVFNGENNRGDILDLAAGARMGILRYGTRDVFQPDGWQLDVEGAAFTRLDPEENMDMEATDYKFGVPLTYGYGCYQMKFAYSHLSSHLGDEFAIRNGLGGRVNYSRDALVWGHSIYANENLRFYFELGYALFCDVNEPWDTQFGVEYSPICNGRFGAPFAAFNTHLREEVNFGGNFVMQLGWQWTSPETAHRIRIGLQYYNGNEEQFEFYSVSEQKVGLGLWYDF